MGDEGEKDKAAGNKTSDDESRGVVISCRVRVLSLQESWAVLVVTVSTVNAWLWGIAGRGIALWTLLSSRCGVVALWALSGWC